MAIAHVHDTSYNFTEASPTLLSPAISPTAGHLLVLTYVSAGNSSQITSISDTKSNTWIQVPNALAVSLFSTGKRSDIWYAANCAGGSTSVTVTTNFNANANIWITEFSGADTSAPLLVGSGNNLAAAGSIRGPDLTPNASGQLLISVAAGQSFATSAVQAPWIGIGPSLGTNTNSEAAYIINPAVSTTHATFNPTFFQDYFSSGAIFVPVSAALTLTLSDSISTSDSLTDAFATTLSDSTTVTDSSPQAFSVQSDILATVSIPVVESLVNQVIPAEVKTYFIVQE